MTMARIWTGAVVFSVIFGIINGKIDAISTSALDGAAAAVSLCISICGVTCLWSGIAEVLRSAGVIDSLARAARPLLRRLFPENAENKDAMAAAASNMTANLLGLGNAATPLGIKAASLMAKDETATHDLCMLIVINTASIQLIPATIGAVRAAAGAATPFDILPAVWITSAVSVAVGITAARLFRRIWK